MFTAVEGEYLIEVHGYASSEYTLEICTSGPGRECSGQGVTAARTIGGACVRSKQTLTVSSAGHYYARPGRGTR